jgi:hypothetical protein
MAYKRIVFFVRSFNDIDHLIPLAHYCSLKEGIRVEVYCVNWEFKLFCNHNIRFLMSHGNCKVDYLWSQERWFSRDGFLTRCIDVQKKIRSATKRKSKSSLKVLRGSAKVLSRITNWAVGIAYDQLPLVKVFGGQRPEALIFDYLNPGALRNRNIVKGAIRESIATFCLPHGILIFSNKYITRAKTLHIDSEGLLFDHYLGGGLVSDYLIWRGVPQDRIKELGSLRFCPEWMKIRESFLNRSSGSNINRDSDDLRITIFLHQLAYNVDFSSLKEFLECFTKISNIQVRIKPHTRGMNEAVIEEITRGAAWIEILPKVDSDDLIHWCDIVVSYGSSIVLEALLKNKVFIYPDFVDTNSIFFKDAKACWSVRNAAELIDAIESLKADINALPYSKERQQALLNKLIFASPSQTDVREEHFQYIVSSGSRSC